MPDTSIISPFKASLGGGLTLNKDVFAMHPGEALQLVNFEPDITGGYRRLNGTTLFNSNIVPQVSSATERIMMSAIFNDLVIAGRGGTILELNNVVPFIQELQVVVGLAELLVKELHTLTILISLTMVQEIR